MKTWARKRQNNLGAPLANAGLSTSLSRKYINLSAIMAYRSEREGGGGTLTNFWWMVMVWVGLDISSVTNFPRRSLIGGCNYWWTKDARALLFSHSLFVAFAMENFSTNSSQPWTKALGPRPRPFNSFPFNSYPSRWLIIAERPFSRDGREGFCTLRSEWGEFRTWKVFGMRQKWLGRGRRKKKWKNIESRFFFRQKTRTKGLRMWTRTCVSYLVKLFPCWGYKKPGNFILIFHLHGYIFCFQANGW